MYAAADTIDAQQAEIARLRGVVGIVMEIDADPNVALAIQGGLGGGDYADRLSQAFQALEQSDA
jgi:hypothetical protein